MQEISGHVCYLNNLSAEKMRGFFPPQMFDTDSVNKTGVISLHPAPHKLD